MKLWTKYNKYWLKIDGLTRCFNLYETREAYIKDYLYKKMNK